MKTLLTIIALSGSVAQAEPFTSKAEKKLCKEVSTFVNTKTGASRITRGKSGGLLYSWTAGNESYLASHTISKYDDDKYRTNASSLKHSLRTEKDTEIQETGNWFFTGVISWDNTMTSMNSDYIQKEKKISDTEVEITNTSKDRTFQAKIIKYRNSDGSQTVVTSLEKIIVGEEEVWSTETCKIESLSSSIKIDPKFKKSVDEIDRKINAINSAHDPETYQRLKTDFDQKWNQSIDPNANFFELTDKEIWEREQEHEGRWHRQGNLLCRIISALRGMPAGFLCN